MCGAAFIVDIKAVRLVVDVYIFRSELIEKRLCGCACTAVCTVYRNKKSLKFTVDGRLDMLVVLAYGTVHGSYSADIRAVNKRHFFRSVKYQRLYLVFNVIGELESCR